MGCAACGGGITRSTFRRSSQEAQSSPPAPRAAMAGSTQQYEVLDRTGRATGRKFATLTAASGYATRIGGSTRPL